MLTPSTMPAADDIPALEAAFRAFVAHPAGGGISGFDGPDAMVVAFTDRVCVPLCGDFNPMPDATHEALLDYAARHHAPLLGISYRDGAAMVIRTWQGFRDRFAA